MDFEFLNMIIRLMIALIITMFIMFLSYRVLGTKVNDLNKNKYIKIIERTQVSKDNSIFIVKIGKKGYVMTSTTNSMDKIDELCEEEIEEIENTKQKVNEEMIQEYKKVISGAKGNISSLINNIMKFKDGRNEEK